MFQATYGAPRSDGYHDYFTYTSPEGVHIDVCFCNTAKGVDGRDRVDIIGFSSTDPSATVAVFVAATPAFFPPDAHFVKDLQTPDVGTLHIYQSQDLARTFPASEFTDSGTLQPLPPGTFAVACPDLLGNCTIVTGD
jgi:hypothetical protein